MLKSKTPPRRDALVRKVDKVAHGPRHYRNVLLYDVVKLLRADRAAMRRVVVKQRARYVWRYT